MAAAQANSVKSYENSPFEQTNVDHDSKVIGREIDADEDQAIPTIKKQTSTSKLLSMISVQADESTLCKREIENLTEEQAQLFLKLVKLCKEDPNAAQQFSHGKEVSAEATNMTASTVTSEDSSQDNHLATAQALLSSSNSTKPTTESQ